MRTSLPVQLAVVVAKALTKQTEMRYQNGAQFAIDLRAVSVESVSLPVFSDAVLPDNGMSMTKTVLFETTVVNPVASVPPSQT